MTVQRAALLVMAVVFAGGSSCEDNKTECSSVAECELNEDCVEGQCVPATVKECTDNGDCANGKVCIEGVCTVRTSRADGGTSLRPDAGGGDGGGGPQGTATIQVTPSDVVDFGSPVVGLDIVKSVLIKNLGPGPLFIFNVGRTAGTSEEFDVATSFTLPRALQVDDEMRVTITYRLADGEADTGSITIASDAAACAHTCPNPASLRVQLFSEFKGVRNLDVQPGLHDYGFIPQGMESAPFAFVARNDGTQTKLLTVQSLTLDGADQAHFRLDPSVMVPTYLQPGAELMIPISYAPLNQGSHTAELVVRANSDNPARAEVRVTVTGRSVPSVDISATPIDFGNVMVGQQRTRATTITNNSNVPVQITSGSFLNGSTTSHFFVAPPSPFPIDISANGGTASMDVLFTPMGTAGPRSDTLRLSHSLNGTPVNVALTGVADPLPPPPGGPDLSITMTFSRDDAGDDGCNSGALNNFQNMDLILEGGGGTCEKPATQAEANARCGGSDNFCTCNFGSQGAGNWRASGGTNPEPYTEENITHNQSGGDGTFFVKNRYIDDCAADWNNSSAAIIQGICGYGGSPPLRYICFPRDQYPYLYVECGQGGYPYYGYCISETTCLNAAQGIAGSACNARKPSTAKTVITIKSANGTVVEERAFCRTFQTAGATKQGVVALIREQGNFRIDLSTIAQGVTQISPSANCP